MKITKTKDGTVNLTGVTMEELRDMIMANCVATAYFTKDATWSDHAKQAMERHRRFEDALRIVEASSLTTPGAQYLPWGKSLTLDPYLWADTSDDAYEVADGRHIRVAEKDVD